MRGRSGTALVPDVLGEHAKVGHDVPDLQITRLSLTGGHQDVTPVGEYGLMSIIRDPTGATLAMWKSKGEK